MKKSFEKKTLDLWKEIDSENWEELINEILEVFFTTSEAQISMLISAWNKKDYELLRRSAHSLKSSCGNVGAKKSHDLLDKIERCILNNQLDDIDNLLHHFFLTHTTSIYELKTYQKLILKQTEV